MTNNTETGDKIMLIFLAVLITLMTFSSVNAQGDFYVAVDGNDGWSGTLALPNPTKTDGPFATLNRARLAVRRLGHDKPVTVLIRGGIYFLEDTVTFEPEDSGTAQSPVTYAAYPGERPVFSGGRKITGWSRDSRGWWRVNIPEAKEGKWNFLSLYVNGKRRYRPRLPESGYYQVAAAVSPSSGEPDAKPDGFEYYADDTKSSWSNRDDIEVLSVHLWNMSRMRIKSVDTASNTVRFTGTTCAKANFGEYAPGQPYFVENVKEALRKPGQWYLDRKTGELAYIPVKGESPDNTEIIAPRLDYLLRMSGDWKNGRYVSHIVFKGLTFAHSNWCTPAGGHHFPQSDAVLPGAILVDSVRDCRFDDCRIKHTGAYGIQLGESCKRIVIEDCELTDLGAGGIKVGFWAPIDPEEAATSHNLIRRNLIAHGGRVQPGGTGIMLGTSHHNRIENNDIFDLYYIGISLGYTWELSTTAHHNVVQDNHIWNIGQGLLSDMGGIYTLGLSPGTVIRRNLIHDVKSQMYGGWGIYLDAVSSEILVEDNVVYRADAGGVHHNRGQNNRIVNNIFALGTESQLTRSQGGEKPSFNLERNIIYWNGGQIFGSNWEDFNFQADYNLYWNTNVRPITFCGLSFNEWQDKGLDSNSVVADPKFTDPESGNFELSLDSPALKLGFRPIDTSKCGRINAASAAIKPAPRAFPDISEPAPIDYGYEDIGSGQRPLFALISEENTEAVVRVTDEDASSGHHCLKFIDTADQNQPYNPNIIYNYKCSEGEVVGSFDVKLMPGAVLCHEWRNASRQDMPGPSIVIDESGNLKANGRTLQKVPMERWLTLTIRCKCGPDSSGEYELKVRVKGEKEEKVYSGLKHHPEFYKLMMLLFIADGTQPGVFYVDNFSVRSGEK